MKGNPQAFAATVAPAIERALQDRGQDPRLAYAIAAQLGLETEYGRRMVGNNLGGVKADRSWQGPAVSAMTTEVEGGKEVRKPQNFRSYASWTESANDYVDFILSNPRYRKAGLFEAKTPSEYFAALQRSGYATDPAYQTKITGTYKSMYGG